MSKQLMPACAGMVAALLLCVEMFTVAPQADAMAVTVYYPPFPVPPKTRSLAQIADHDVIVFIDASKSMSKPLSGEPRWTASPKTELPPGAPPTESRWQWCAQQTESLGQQVESAFRGDGNGHFKVVIFNDRFKVFPNVDLSSVPAFFANNHPGGNTNAVLALRTQLREHFAAKKNGGNVRPLLVAMITDGCPDDPLELRQLIINATKNMNDPGEIAITFLQVGIDPKATRYLHELDRDLVREKAQYDIVTTKTFDEVNKSGLAMALVDAVQR